MEQREKKILVIKNLVYFAFVLLLFVMGEIPKLSLFGFNAIPVISAVVAISMAEDNLYGGIYGFIAGLMVDTYAAHIFGLASAVFAVLGFVAGSLVIYLLQDNMRTSLILTAAFSSIYGIICHYVLYGMWDVEGGFLFFFYHTVPMVLLSSLFAFPSYLVVKKIKAKIC